MVVYRFYERTFGSYCDLLRCYEDWQWESLVMPFKRRIEPVLTSAVATFESLQAGFLGRSPVRTAGDEDPLFFSQSQKRHAHQVARRYALGIQPRGTSLADVRLKDPRNMTQHVDVALKARHPALLVEELLDPTWKFVFDQMKASFFEHGADETYVRLNQHRAVMLDFFESLAVDLQPYKEQLAAVMPYSVKKMAGHIHVPLFYVILVCTRYPNPDLAFRLLLGAPIMGEFESSALLQREQVGLPMTDSNLRKVAAECREACRHVHPHLTDAGAEQCMKKVDKELAKSSLEGPFATHAELCEALQAELRQHDGLEDFVLDHSLVIVGPTFSVEELQAWTGEDQDEDPDVIPEPRIRNIWNGVLPNQMCTSYATYVPNTHADVSVIMMRWLSILSVIGPFSMLAWKSDFSGAYRQMPLRVMHLISGASCHWNYRTHKREYVFYRSLPFGSSLAPAGWSEIVFALCHILAFSVLSILSHCVDDVCSIEMHETVMSSRTLFLRLCALIGLVIDMDKSPEPCDKVIFLGLNMLCPARIPRGDVRHFALSVTPLRRLKLLTVLRSFLDDCLMTPAQASSLRGKLMFYTCWHQAARSYLSEFAARQYSNTRDFTLTEDLVMALQFFIDLLHDPSFLKGIKPELLYNREVSVIYTDGALEGDKTFKGVGGVLFHLRRRPPLFFSEVMTPALREFESIAPIEMHGVIRALEHFQDFIRNKAVLFFIDNTHVIGCLLKRSATIRERDRKRDRDGNFVRGTESSEYSHFVSFSQLSVGLRRVMNQQARKIWKLITSLNVIVWFEYVKSKCNIADPPSRGVPLPIFAIPIEQGYRMLGNSNSSFADTQ